MRVAGFGFRRAAGIGSLRAAYDLTGAAADVLATAEAKVSGLEGLARELGVPVIGISVQALAAQEVSGSARVRALHGTGSVAEASALAAAGQGARLVVARVTSPDGMAVAAIAEGPGGMTVHFIGAGPGAADLLTLRGRDLIAACPVCLYAGSLVPEGVLAHCPPGARIVNTAPLSLDEIIAEISAADAQGQDVARLHSGDLSVWSAMGEQLRRLRALGIGYDVTPGVPSFAAAAAALGVELTLPGVAQSVVLTRTSGRASPMPSGETLAAFAATGATLAVHLSVQALGEVVAQAAPFYGADCPVAVVWRASWPDERVIRATLATIVAVVGPEIDRTALILVGRALAAEDFADSRLYAGDYDRRYRPSGPAPRFPERS